MSTINYNYIAGVLCIVFGIAIIIVALGDLLLRVLIALAALSLINYGLRLRGLPPLQSLILLLARQNRWF
jgi:hypothetical protein